MQLWKLKAKMDFYLAKHGLNLKMDLRPNWSQFGRENRGEEKEKRRREEEEEEEEEEGRRSSKLRSKVWNYMGFKALNGFSMPCLQT